MTLPSVAVSMVSRDECRTNRASVLLSNLYPLFATCTGLPDSFPSRVEFVGCRLNVAALFAYRYPATSTTASKLAQGSASASE